MIITVHGTNDADLSEAGHRWWQHGSNFTRRLIWELDARGFPGAELHTFQWSGANSDYDRLKGAKALSISLQKIDKTGAPIAILGHSHGGNVVMEALGRVRATSHLGGVVTFGTPFFTRSLKTVPWLIAMFQCILGLTIVPIMLWYLAVALGSDTNKKIEAVLLFGGLAAAGGWGLLAGLRKLNHNRLACRSLAGLLDPARWLVIHSPRDEAMRLLESAAMLSPHYVTTANATRALTAFASLAGVLSTIAFFVWNGRYFLEPIATKIAAGQGGLGLAADFTFLLLVPVIYGAVYALIVGIARLGGGWLYGKILSHAIHGGIIGAAFGGDGPFKLTAVTRLPPYLAGCAENRIEALNLGGIDDATVFEAARKLYDSVVANDGPDGGISDPDGMWKRLSDALYHNAYMRDEHVVARVADHIVEGWRAAGADGTPGPA